MQQYTQAAAESPVAITDNGFVINLASSTTPVPLPQVTHPELQRFKFFVSRRRDDGRERFRLHLGYFSTQEEAEGLLELVREIYPAAWAGIAPGQKLRAQQAEKTVPALLKLHPVAAAGSELPPVAHITVPPTLQPVPIATTAAPAAKPAREHGAAAQSLNSVRAAIASLDATAERKAAAAKAPLTDAQVLKVLEPSKPASAAPVVALTPRNELTMYALQLAWSVKPIAMAEVPPLAIFSAYTLYGAEGNRDGRRWYGLRLGFFTDATSAKQVAHYVRSEFASVSVVPVTLRERERALTAAQKAANNPMPAAVKPGSGQFKLLDDKVAAPPPPVSAPVKQPQVKQPPGKRAKARPGAAKKSGKTKREISLEETLEILGASELQIDNGRGELLNDSGVRHLHLEAGKSRRGSKLGRLIDRLAERLGD